MPLNYFIVDEGKSLLRIPQKVMHELPAHSAALPDYAGKQVRVVEVRTIDDAQGVPEQIGNISGFYLNFDETGLLRKDLYDEWIRSGFYKLSIGFPRDEKIVHFEDRAKQRDAELKHEWKPTQQEISTITDAALGHPKAIKNVKSTKMKRAPDPDVSYDTRSAFEDIREAISKIGSATYQLGEAELLGLHQMIEHRLEKIEHQEIWRGVIADNLNTLKLLEAKRTGSGEWVAVVEIMKWDETETEARSIKCWHETHPTRETALEAARRLTKEHASYLVATTSLEARIISALDWSNDPPAPQSAD